MTHEATPVSRGDVTQGSAVMPQHAIDALSARAAGENFPVALRALPSRYRRHLMAVYRFARLVDDIGDETRAEMPLAAVPLLPAAPAGGDTAVAGGHARPPAAADRLRMLDLVEQDLDRALTQGGGGRLQVIRDIGRTAAECAIPAEPFRLLIQANRQDQTVRRYASFEELLGYCRLSANPVGHAVLHVFGVATPERERLSDLVCTALQLAEHWQDVAEDFTRGRIYLPQEDMAAFGCTERDLAEAVRASSSSAHPAVAAPLRRLLRFETERARRLLDDGAALTRTLHGWARIAVAGYVAGGRATLTAIAASGAARAGRATACAAGGDVPAGFDVFAATPRPGRARTAAGLVRAYLTGR